MFDSGMTSTIASSSLFIVIAVPLAASILLRAARSVLKGCRGRAADRQIVDGRVYFIIVSHYFKLGESRCDPLGFVGPRQTFASLIPAAKQSEIQNKVKFKRCPKSIGIIRFGTALIRGQMPAKNGRNLGAAAKLSGLAASTPGFTNIFLQSGYLKSLRASVAGPDF